MDSAGGNTEPKQRDHLLLLGCSKDKKDVDCELAALDLYDGSPYTVVRSYLRHYGWPDGLSIGILSAEYGLIGALTPIRTYEKRMNAELRRVHCDAASDTLARWRETHKHVHVALGVDYRRVFRPDVLRGTNEFKGGIGYKLQQVKGLLEGIDTEPRLKPPRKRGTGVSYFLPDWDDLLDPRFDFRADKFSASTRSARGDLHCCQLMGESRMCDGILVSLAQHFTSKGPLRRFRDEESTLAPRNLRSWFGLANDQYLFGDCGAFSYADNDEPAFTVEQAVSHYELNGFDYGASVDHIPLPSFSEEERRRRCEVTLANAEAFLAAHRRRKATFSPVGTVQGITPEDYARNAIAYAEMGYHRVAIGGLVPRTDADIKAIVEAVSAAFKGIRNRPWLHLFGVFRPNLQADFRRFGVNSFDSATYFRKAWLRSDQNYLGRNGKWYAAIRVPMTADPRTRAKLEKANADIAALENHERNVLSLLSRYGARQRVSLETVLRAVIAYDSQVTRGSIGDDIGQAYRRTLENRPWEDCDCPMCKEAGIHVAIFRGSNRNKRRGAHNTLMLYQRVKE